VQHKCNRDRAVHMSKYAEERYGDLLFDEDGNFSYTRALKYRVAAVELLQREVRAKTNRILASKMRGLNTTNSDEVKLNDADGKKLLSIELPLGVWIKILESAEYVKGKGKGTKPDAREHRIAELEVLLSALQDSDDLVEQGVSPADANVQAANKWRSRLHKQYR